MKFKFNTIGSNKNGTKIFCKLKCNKHNIIRGFYDFDKEKFIITKYYYDNIKIINNENNITKNVIKNILKNILLTDYDWKL